MKEIFLISLIVTGLIAATPTFNYPSRSISNDTTTTPEYSAYGDDRDKEKNPSYKTLGRHALPIGRKRTEKEVLDSIEFAREKMLKEYPLQAELIKRIAALELGAVYRKPNDKAPSLVLQGLPGMGKSTIFTQWLKYRDKVDTYKSEVMTDKTVEFPVDSILRSAPKISKNNPAGDSSTYFDGLDRIFNIDEVDKMKTLQSLRERHEELKALGQKAIEMQIEGQAGGGIGGPGTWVSPDDLLRFEDPLTDYEERMRSLKRLWSILDSGFATPEPLHSAQRYVHLFNKLLDKVSAAQLQVKHKEEQISQLRQTSAGGTALKSAEVELNKYHAARDLVIEETYRLMRNMRMDYAPMFSEEELSIPYQSQVEAFVADPEKAKKYIKDWDARIPRSGRGQQYDMRGTLSVWSLNSPQLREVRELFEHRKLPATPEEAQATVKALEQIFLDDFESLFYDRFTDREGGKRRFNFEGFQKLLMVPNETEWKETIKARLEQKAEELKMLLKDSNPDIKIRFDKSVHEGLYNLTVDGFQGWDEWRTKFDLYTKTFFSELMHTLKKNPKDKIYIGIDSKKGQFAVFEKNEVTNKPERFFNYKPTEKSLAALHQPKKEQRISPLKDSNAKAAKAVVAASLLAAVPRTTDPEFKELDHGYGIRGQYDVPSADMLEYELKVALAEIAGFVWQREGANKFDVSHDVGVDYDRAFRIIEHLVRDPQLKKNVIEYLDGYVKRQGINRILPWFLKINRLKPLDQVIPVHLKNTLIHKKISGDPELAYIFESMYALDSYILKRNHLTVADVARKLRNQSKNESDPNLTEKDFKNILMKTYNGGWGQAPLGMIMEAAPGEGTMQGCIHLLANVSTRGKVSRYIKDKLSSPGKVQSYKLWQWFLRVFRNN